MASSSVPMRRGEDVFVHMETVRNAHLGELLPGQQLEARIAASGKGLTAVELRDLGAEISRPRSLPLAVRRLQRPFVSAIRWPTTAAQTGLVKSR